MDSDELSMKKFQFELSSMFGGLNFMLIGKSAAEVYMYSKFMEGWSKATQEQAMKKLSPELIEKINRVVSTSVQVTVDLKEIGGEHNG